MSEKTLFIYGSFVDGHVHYKKIQPFVESKVPAKARGAVYRLEVGYPVFLANEQSIVSGYLVRFVASDVVMPLLDEFHGFNSKNPEKSLFIRTPLSVALEGDEFVATSVYAMNPVRLPKEAKLIMDGDWERDFNSIQPLTCGLTETQKRYILKLGASLGRDIVPINLDLYRELMNKGLLVDKGRRLALTSLGKEVFRYLEE